MVFHFFEPFIAINEKVVFNSPSLDLSP